VLDEDSNIELAVSSKYLTLASFAALIKYYSQSASMKFIEN
jgi:hypothetical protein